MDCAAVPYQQAWAWALRFGNGDSDDNDETIHRGFEAYRHALWLCLASVLITFVVSTATQNYSQVDKLWSILPFVYAWMAVVDQRTLLMAILATVWGLRLSYNFYRRGGYAWPPWQGDEDYRWAVIQRGELLSILKEPIPWILFNFGFTSLYQNVLLLLIASPSFVAYSVATVGSPDCQELVSLDYVAAALFVFFLIVETIADNQQYQFQTEKYRLKQAGQKLTGDYAAGFCRSGLFAIVRKPNYAAEQAIWVCFYLFSAAAKREAWNGSAVGFLLLLGLFQSSGWFTEKLTRQKYNQYDAYMKQVPLYIPNPVRLLYPIEKKSS